MLISLLGRGLLEPEKSGTVSQHLNEGLSSLPNFPSPTRDLSAMCVCDQEPDPLHLNNGMLQIKLPIIVEHTCCARCRSAKTITLTGLQQQYQNNHTRSAKTITLAVPKQSHSHRTAAAVPKQSHSQCQNNPTRSAKTITLTGLQQQYQNNHTRSAKTITLT